jgi:hypothetical protein
MAIMLKPIRLRMVLSEFVYFLLYITNLSESEQRFPGKSKPTAGHFQGEALALWGCIMLIGRLLLN